MKKKIIINYCNKRTFNLGDYENTAPIHTITEEVELNDGEVYTTEDYEKDFARLKRIVRDQMREEAIRVKSKDMSYMSSTQFTQIGLLAKKKGKSIDEEVKKMGWPSIGSLSAQAAETLIHNLESYE